MGDDDDLYSEHYHQLLLAQQQHQQPSLALLLQRGASRATDPCAASAPSGAPAEPSHASALGITDASTGTDLDERRREDHGLGQRHIVGQDHGACDRVDGGEKGHLGTFLV